MYPRANARYTRCGPGSASSQLAIGNGSDQPPPFARSTQLELLLHRRVRRIVVEDALGVVGLAKGGPTDVLAHFDVKVAAEEVEVAHVECLLHLRLEHLHLLLFNASDDEVDVDVEQCVPCPASTPPPRVRLKPIFLSVALSLMF